MERYIEGTDKTLVREQNKTDPHVEARLRVGQ